MRIDRLGVDTAREGENEMARNGQEDVDCKRGKEDVSFSASRFVDDLEREERRRDR